MQPTTTNATDRTDRAERLRELRALLRPSVAPSVAGRDSQSACGSSPWAQLVGEIKPRRLLDCLAGATGSGVGLVALHLCWRACQHGGELVVVDRSNSFYPPAAIAWGVDAKKLLVVTPPNEQEAIAVAEIALRSPAVGAVWATLGLIDDRSFRRLLLATEAGNAFGVIVRSARYQPQPSWADVQLRFDPLLATDNGDAPFHVRVTQIRNRHGPVKGKATLAIDWRTGLIEELAPDLP